jgi:hypothetical protein
VEVVHGLAAVGLAVDHKAGALFGAALFRRKLLCLKEEASQEGMIPALQFHDIPDVPFGDDKKMNRRLGRDVVKGQKLVILVDLFGRNFTGRDFTENTVAHGWIVPRGGGLFPVVYFTGFYFKTVSGPEAVMQQEKEVRRFHPRPRGDLQSLL